MLEMTLGDIITSKYQKSYDIGYTHDVLICLESGTYENDVEQKSCGFTFSAKIKF
jgi:hypothetical protein